MDAKENFSTSCLSHRQYRSLPVANGTVCSHGSTDLVSGLYTTPAIAINVKGVCTNTVPVCAYRGAGRPEASYLIERLVDAAAREMNMSLDKIRRINFISEKAIPYTSPTKLAFDSGEFEKVMDLAMENADWKNFTKRRKESERRGKLRGIGMATYTERCGGAFPETASIEFKKDRVELVMGNQEYGTGIVTSYKQLVSEFHWASMLTKSMSYMVTWTALHAASPGVRARFLLAARHCTRHRLRSSARGSRLPQICWKFQSSILSLATDSFGWSEPIEVSVCSTLPRQQRIQKTCHPAQRPASIQHICKLPLLRHSRTAATSRKSRLIQTVA